MKSLTKLAILTAAPLMAAPALAAPPAVFLMHAAQGDYTEVQMGHMAMERGASAEVRDFGQRLVHDHGDHLGQVHQLADRMHVRVADRLKPGAAATAARLRRLRGPAFDRAFAADMVMDHRHDIAEYEAQSRQHDETGPFAQQTLPTLREHLRMAEGIHH